MSARTTFVLTCAIFVAGAIGLAIAGYEVLAFFCLSFLLCICGEIPSKP